MKNWLLGILLLLVISVKFYYAYMSGKNQVYTEKNAYNGSDAGHYLLIGRNIAHFGVYSDNDTDVPTENATWRPPLWPAVLAVFFTINSNPWFLILAKCVLETSLMVFALFYLKRKLGWNLFTLLPFLFLFLEPYYLKYSVTFLSESITAVLIFLLVVIFATLRDDKRHHILIPVLAALIILCHPVSFFFIVIFMGIYLLYNYKFSMKIAGTHGLLFAFLVLSWPVRNYFTFDKGLYITASQGATFSKGWNETVLTQFTNADGDLADETLNLKYVDPALVTQSAGSVLDMGQLYKQGTYSYIETLSFTDKLAISFKKIKSNFNPIAGKPKLGFLENAAVVARFVYLLLFLQTCYRLTFRWRSVDFNSKRDRLYLFVFSVICGQIVMSVFIYTGLRFNCIYALALLFCFVYLNVPFFREIRLGKFSR